MQTLIADVDGVAADFSRHALNILGLTHLTPKDVAPQFEDSLSPEDKDRYKILAASPEFWLTLPVMDGAQDEIEKLRRRDIRVHWCSSPFDTAPLWHWARTQWLKKHFNSDLTDFTATKEKFRVRGDWFLEDSSDNIDGWLDSRVYCGGRAFVFDQPYNRTYQRGGVQRVTWTSLSNYIG
jgi:5'(3')-deoxyribonucleotidase